MIAATGIRTNDYWEVHRRAEQWPELDCPERSCGCGAGSWPGSPSSSADLAESAKKNR